jgi:hypothetical protein
MPLAKVQSDILRLIASHRDPESYVAGSTPLNVAAPRYSGDIDVFHDREAHVARAAETDAAILKAHGFELEWLRREPALYALVARRDGEATKLEWAVDSDYRFFPTMRDAVFGYILHPVDLATNKAMAAAARREPRDVVDLLTVHERILPLGAVIWAAAGKSPGFTPEGLTAEIRRVGRYTEAEFRAVASDPPIDAAETMSRLRRALDAADTFIARMPTDRAGLLFLADGKVVEPDPNRLDRYTTHAGQRRGHWPGGVEIDGAMLERHDKEKGSRA